MSEDDFCLIHGYDFMESKSGDPIKRCTKCEPDWECTECGYDRKESGNIPPPTTCPICAGDCGKDGNIIRRGTFR